MRAKGDNPAGMIPLELLSKQSVVGHVIKEIGGSEGIAREIVALLRDSEATPATRWGILQNISRAMEEVSSVREESMTVDQARNEILALVKEVLDGNISASAMAEVRAAIDLAMDDKAPDGDTN